MIKKIGIFGNIEKTKALTFAKQLYDWCLANNIRPFLERTLCEKIQRGAGCEIYNNKTKADLIISLGGDGFLLSVARDLYPSSIPVLSVNLGKLGFNSSLEPDRLFDFIKKHIKSPLPIQKRSLLKTCVIRDGEKIFDEIGMNDAVILKDTHSRMIVLDVRVDGEQIYELKADGLIVSTPTGSTAYNLSSGGPIIHPAEKLLLITPICPHSLTHRSIGIPNTSKVSITQKIEKSHEEAICIVDGHKWIKIDKNDVIIVEKAARPLNLIYEDGVKYYENLKRKMLWGGYPDEKK